MALRQILTEPNDILRQKSLPVEKVDLDLQKLMDDMLETMYAAPGICLAAIQVGVPKRVIVLDLSSKEEQKKPMYFVNPEIIKKSKITLLMKRDVYRFQDNLLKLIDQKNAI